MESFQVETVFLSLILVLLCCQGVICNKDLNEVVAKPPKITHFMLESGVSSRFAKVKITTRVVNDAKEGREAMFQVQFPKEAFMSNFTMTIGNEVRRGVVKQKDEAKEIYDKAKEDGKSAGQVAQSPSPPGRDMDTFVVNVNVAAQSSTVFELSYRELIEMKLGRYVQKLHIEPGQVVGNLSVTATIQDTQGIQDFVYILPNSTDTMSSSSENAVYSASVNKRSLTYQPSLQEQMENNKEKGINGDLVISYGIERKNTGGIILVDGGYFVHYFSPSGLEAIPKNIVFVIDISGSMSGLKIDKVREVMAVILDKLRPDDYFNLLLFDDKIQMWKGEPMRASQSSVAEAKRYANEKLHARGSTNINDALLDGLDLLAKTRSLGGERGNILVFLTDGQPTSGVTSTFMIRENVRKRNKGLVSLYALGFGYNLNMEFLKALAWENGGFARRIYEEADASEQLETFYEEIESPVLLNVKMTYEPYGLVQIQELTQTSFSQYRNGSELVVAGKFSDGSMNELDLVGRVGGSGKKEMVTYSVSPQSVTNAGFAEKLWAYLKIKDLLKEAAVAIEETRQDQLEERALNLSLKYQFVTPLTSMVVTTDMPSDTPGGDIMPEAAQFDLSVRGRNMYGMAKVGGQGAVQVNSVSGPFSAASSKDCFHLLLFLPLLIYF